MLSVVTAAVALALLAGCAGDPTESTSQGPNGSMPSAAETIRVYSVRVGRDVEVERVLKTEPEWKRQLSSLEFQVTRQKGTERAFTGRHWRKSGEPGIYRCIGCGNDLFSSSSKYDSGTGWPSFWEPVAKQNIRTELDEGLFMRRVEVLCRRCDAHLGHVFSDGPKPTGLRYCVNSAALSFAAD